MNIEVLAKKIESLEKEAKELKSKICNHERTLPKGKHSSTYGCTIWMCRDCGVLLADKSDLSMQIDLSDTRHTFTLRDFSNQD